MDAEETPVLVHRDGPVLWLTLNRPRVLNAIDPAMLARLEALVTDASRDESVRAVVIAAAGRAFCVGADLVAVRDAVAGGHGFTGPDGFAERLSATFSLLERVSKPTIAAVNGFALAGGLELVLCCDLVIAADDAMFGDAHVNYALLPTGGGSVRLPRRVGLSWAKRLMLTGDFIPGTDLLGTGFVTEVVAPADLAATAGALATRLADKPPLALSRLKCLVNDSEETGSVLGLRLEQVTMQAHAASQEMHVGLHSFAGGTTDGRSDEVEAGQS